METILIVIVLQAIIFGAFCSFIAKEKNRDSAGWFITGFFFSLIALLALIAVPQLDKKNNPQKTEIEKPKPDWYYKPIPVLSAKQKALRLLLIFFGLVAFLVLVILLNK